MVVVGLGHGSSRRGECDEQGQDASHDDDIGEFYFFFFVLEKSMVQR